MTRALFLAAALLCVACATPGAGRPRAEGELAIALSRDVSREVSGTWPILIVSITNRSPHQICIQRDTLQNPDSYGMELHLYDARGRAVRPGPEGFIPPPMEGIVRLEPGGNTRGRYYLNGRFELGENATPLPPRMNAQVSFPYGYCEDTWARRATSARQPI
jgi:hypothetical protein